MDHLRGFVIIFPREYMRAALLVSLRAFLLVCGFVGRMVVNHAVVSRIASFILIAFACVFSVVSVYRLRRCRQFVVSGLLVMGVYVWSVYLGNYPFSHKYASLF